MLESNNVFSNKGFYQGTPLLQTEALLRFPKKSETYKDQKILEIRTERYIAVLLVLVSIRAVFSYIHAQMFVNMQSAEDLLMQTDQYQSITTPNEINIVYLNFTLSVIIFYI